MIVGRHFTLITDHKPLIDVFRLKKEITVHTANRLQRWATTLCYDFTIKYQSTTDFGQAEALSRLIGPQSEIPEDTFVANIKVEKDVHRVLNDVIDGLLVTSEAIK